MSFLPKEAGFPKPAGMTYAGLIRACHQPSWLAAAFAARLFARQALSAGFCNGCGKNFMRQVGLDGWNSRKDGTYELWRAKCSHWAQGQRQPTLRQ
jgi:hypothetical protein